MYMHMNMSMNMNMNLNMNMNVDVNTYGHWSIMLLVKRFGSSGGLISSSGGIAALLCLHNQK